ncbi:MFS transporter [Anaerosporomusa subterranea]|uniref:MFS transporter n=1 Tax=Anaerosporomusa subterranea TaxID=1794912 RepID=A0A154BW41_ANASB|nr:MFS transporter [Anaerosporomusa subterranea]KYZ78156.1 MFS transporter [Anaerosporomusa subterranea]
MDNQNAKGMSYSVIAAAWLAVFCLFGYRATFAVLSGPMASTMKWTGAEVSLGYSLMMSIYAITAFFSGMIIDKWGTKPVYTIAAVFGMLGFYLTSRVDSLFAYYACYAIFAGIGTGMLWVSSTISVRKWFVGKYYAKMWGIAFAGAPMAQVLLSLGVKPLLVQNAAQWRDAMNYLAWITLVLLLIAAALAKKNPEQYGITPFGAVPAAPGTAAKQEHIWSVGEAFGTAAIWGAVLAFLTSMVAEFLIWTQVVRYWTKDLGMSLDSATNLYVAIGIAGIFTMPLMGIVADKVVGYLGNEVKGRKAMLVFAPLVGVAACLLLLKMDASSGLLGIVVCILFATYWAIEPGGVVGYSGAVYGRVSLGKIWGTATLIVMGIGPALGSYMGGYLADTSGNFTASIQFAMAAFAVSAIVAFLLPLSATAKVTVQGNPNAAPVEKKS